MSATPSEDISIVALPLLSNVLLVFKWLLLLDAAYR